MYTVCDVSSVIKMHDDDDDDDARHLKDPSSQKLTSRDWGYRVGI